MSNNQFRDPITEELRKQARSFDKIDKKRAESMEALQLRPEWKDYVALLESLIDQKGMEILAPAKSVDGAFALEHIKGAMCGLILARDLPRVIVAQMKAVASPATENSE